RVVPIAPSKTTTPRPIASMRSLSAIRGVQITTRCVVITWLVFLRRNGYQDAPMLKIVVGNKKYSSWSLRGWLALKLANVPYEEVVVPLDMPDTAGHIRKYSPSGRVPALIDGDVTVWDSLAIGECLHEKVPDGRLWPKDSAQRARARSVAAEMHSGFGNLRNDCSMKIVQQYPYKTLRPETQADVDRIVAIWQE